MRKTVEKVRDQILFVCEKVFFAILAGFYWSEKQYDQFLKPKLQKMSAKCWIGTVALIALGYMLAKIL